MMARTELDETNSQIIQAWRYFVSGLPHYDNRELPGLSVAWGNASLAFYNAIFLSAPVTGIADLEDRTHRALAYMNRRDGMLVLAAEWLPDSARAAAPSIAAAVGLHAELHMTGMVASSLLPPVRPLPQLACKRVGDRSTREAISDINALAYGISVDVCRETCAAPELWGEPSFGYVAYRDGKPVSTAAARAIGECLYVYMVATLPGEQRRGYAEAVMRHALQRAGEATGFERTTLHASPDGFPIYRRMGYHATAEFTAYMPGPGVPQGPTNRT